MKILVTGINGQLGFDVTGELIARGHQVTGSGSSEMFTGIQNGSPACFAPYVQLDISDEQGVMKAVSGYDAVVNCAAWTKVDDAEEPSNRDRVFAVNASAPGYFADACHKCGIPLVHISTDYVYGSGGTHGLTEEEECRPEGVYSVSKLAGEEQVRKNTDKYYILRIAWGFGLNGSNFVKTMLRLGKNRDELKVVNDQFGNPTYTKDAAVLVADLVENKDETKYGVYNVTNGGEYISWYDFACEIFRQACLRGAEEYGIDRLKVTPVMTKEYGLNRAPRPFNSRLDKSKLENSGFGVLPHWRDALERYFDELTINNLF